MSLKETHKYVCTQIIQPPATLQNYFQHRFISPWSWLKIDSLVYEIPVPISKSMFCLIGELNNLLLFFHVRDFYNDHDEMIYPDDRDGRQV